MKCTEFEFDNISMLGIKHTNLSHISHALTSAYNIIFGKNKAYLDMLTKEEVDTINRMIKSCFELLSTLPRYNPQCEPEHDIIRMIRIALSHWFYEQYQTKRTKHKLEKNTYIWQIPKQDETNLRKKFKTCFGAMPEQLLASCFFYLIPTLIKSIEEQDLWTYGAIIATIAETNILIQNNASQIAGGKSIHTKEKKLEKAFNRLKDEYPNIKNKPSAEKVLYCQEHCNLTEEEAKMVLNAIETTH